MPLKNRAKGYWLKRKQKRLTYGYKRRPDHKSTHVVVVVLEEESGASGSGESDEDAIHTVGEQTGQEGSPGNALRRLL